MTPRRTARAAMLLALAVATAAEACPVCFAGTSPRVLWTYRLSAALLTLLPLAIAGTFALWLRARSRAPR